MIDLAHFFRRPEIQPSVSERTFDLMCLTTAFVLAVHAMHVPVPLTFAFTLGLVLRWWQRKHRPGKVPGWLKISMLVILVGAVIARYGNVFGREPGSALAAGLLVLKLTESESSRDARVAAAFACFLLMAALLFGQSLIATFVVALGLLPALSTWRSLEPTDKVPSFPRQLLPALMMLGVSMPIAATAFLLVPRLSSPLWGASGQPAARSGLSDQMSPGDFSEVLNDDSPAMRVTFDGPLPPNNERYFRAFVLWNYDGENWTRADMPAVDALPIEMAGSILYRINLEPTHQRVLPALDVPLHAPAQSRLRADGELFAEKPVDDVLDYALRSALHYHFQHTIDTQERSLALALPDGLDPRSHQFAAELRGRYGHDDVALINAVLDFFHHAGFRYTLAPAPLGHDAIDDFLFHTREGFCEHYAASFTVLMRAAGIPARVVTGYQGGYWNAMGSYLLVRNSDAHAWSEVWLSGRGWVRVDPTAAVQPQRISLGAADTGGDQLAWYRSEWLESARNHWDIVNQWWNKGIVGFDALRQRGLLTPFGIRDADAGMLGRLLALSAGLFGAVGLAWALWRRPEGDPALAAMRRLERKLARAGIVRASTEGPRNYLRRAMRVLPGQRAELHQLMNCYLGLRYASVEPAAESLRAFRLAVRNFQPRRVV